MKSLTAEANATRRGLWSGGRGWILVAVSLGWTLSVGVRFVFPALVPFIREEFGLGLTATGLLLTLLWGTYALGHVPAGVLGDRVGDRNILFFSTLLSAGTMLVVSASVNVEMLFAGTVLFGLATALYGPTRLTIFTNIYTERAASAIGINMAAGSLGNALFPVVGAFVATYTAWRIGFGMFVPAFLLASVAIWVTVPSHTSGPTSAVDDLSRQTIADVLDGVTSGSILTMVGVQICISFTVQGFSSFYPSYLAEIKEFSPGLAATMFGVFFGVGSLLQPVSGTLADRFGPQSTLVGLLGGAVVALWALPFASGLGQIVAVTVLLSTLTGCLVITQSSIAQTLPDEIQNTGMGGLKAGWMLLGASSPLLIGVLADYGHYDGGFMMLAAVTSAGLVLAAVRL